MNGRRRTVVLGQPIERVLVRYLRDRQKSSNLSPIFSRSRPFQIYLAFEDGDNPGEIVSAMFSTRNLLLVTDVLSTYIITHFDFRCFTSTSPSNSDTFETEMTSSPVAFDCNGHQLSLEPLLGPWCDVLLLPVPIGSRCWHRRRHFYKDIKEGVEKE